MPLKCTEHCWQTHNALVVATLPFPLLALMPNVTHLPQRISCNRSARFDSDFHTHIRRSVTTVMPTCDMSALLYFFLPLSVFFLSRLFFWHHNVSVGCCRECQQLRIGTRSRAQGANALKDSNTSAYTRNLRATTLINIGCVHEWMFAMCCQSWPKSSFKRFIPWRVYGAIVVHNRFLVLVLVFTLLLFTFLFYDSQDRNVLFMFPVEISVFVVLLLCSLLDVCFFSTSQSIDSKSAGFFGFS